MELDGHILGPFDLQDTDRFLAVEIDFRIGHIGNNDQAFFPREVDQICEECDQGAMPLPSYVLIHRSAKLSEQDIQALCEWTETESLKMLKGE